jgi:hypothetical protein
MAYTQTQIDALRNAIAIGATKVRQNGEEVTYRSLAEMKAILADMEASVASTARPKIGVVQYVRD